MSQKRQRKKTEKARRSPAAKPTARPAKRITARGHLEGTAERARRMASDIIRQSDSPERAEEISGSLRRLALRVADQSPLHDKHECREGCAFCCHTAVTVAPPEALTINAYLSANYSKEELASVREALEANAALASELSRDDYIARNIPCALLTSSGQCRAHPVRPLACAGFLSTSRAGCEAEFKHLAGRDEVPTDKFAMLAALAISYGLKDACRQSDLDGEFYELHHALLRVQDTPDAGAGWSIGDPVFEGCLT